MSQPARYPGYLPYPTAIERMKGEYSVPNESSVNWPQAQFAPPYLAQGSPSVQPYRYHDGPLFEPSLYSDAESSLGGIGAELGEADADYGAVEGAAAAVSQYLRVAAMLAAPVAMAISYKRNHSLPWAFATGFVALPYLTYVAYDHFTEDKTGLRYVPEAR